MTTPFLRQVIVAMALFALSTIPSEAPAEERQDVPACQTQLDVLNSYLAGEARGNMSRLGQGPVQLGNGEWYPASEVDSIRQELNRAERLCHKGRVYEAATEMGYVRRHLHLAAVSPPDLVSRRTP